MRENRATEQDSQKQFLTGFGKFVEERLNKNKELLVGIDVKGDNNEGSNIKMVFEKHDLINAHKYLHGDSISPKTNRSRSHQTDYIMITSGLLTA
eukprot:2271497-Ditylum_brightwellii.AAC.1